MMIKKALFAASLLSSTLLPNLLHANGTVIKELVFFGDSLSDNGNLYSHDFHLVPKSPPYYEGRFSDGPNWADKVSEDFAGQHHTTFQNYAVGGATTFLHNPFAGFLPVTVGEQLDDYYVRDLLKDKSHTLFFLWSSANDYLPGNKDVEAVTTKVVSTEMSDINSLVKAGAKNLFVLNLPDLGSTPEAINQNRVDNLHQLSVMHNSKLAIAIADYQQQHPDVDLHLYDVYALFQQATTDINAFNAKYGTHFTIINKACWPGGYAAPQSKQQISYQLTHGANKKLDSKTVSLLTEFISQSPDLYAAYRVGQDHESGAVACSNPDQHVFWDQVHPTRYVHSLLASLIEKEAEQDYQFQP